MTHKPWSIPLLAFIVMVPIIHACTDKPKNPVAEYGDAMINAHQKTRNTAVIGNLDAIQKSVDAFHAANDKYPESLQEIAGMLDSSVDLNRFNYDPQTGRVRIK